MNRPMVVALTGGIGSGKSTVAAMFAELGVTVVDADEISRNVARRGGPAFEKLLALLGPEALAPGGELRRDLIRKTAFEDEALRRAIEAIIHPLVYSEIRRRVAETDRPYCIVSVPLLIETGKQASFDRVLLIDAPEELRLKRAAERDGLPFEEIRKIMRSQATGDERRRAAHDIIRNDADLGQLRSEIERLHRDYLELARTRVAG